MLNGVRTRNGSESFVFALAIKRAPKAINVIAAAITNLADFLNILAPQNQQTFSLVISLNDLSGSILGCSTALEGWQRSADILVGGSRASCPHSTAKDISSSSSLQVTITTDQTRLVD